MDPKVARGVIICLADQVRILGVQVQQAKVYVQHSSEKLNFALDALLDAYSALIEWQDNDIELALALEEER